jgi:hypothetical protein
MAHFSPVRLNAAADKLADHVFKANDPLLDLLHEWAEEVAGYSIVDADGDERMTDALIDAVDAIVNTFARRLHQDRSIFWERVV